MAGAPGNWQNDQVVEPAASGKVTGPAQTAERAKAPWEADKVVAAPGSYDDSWWAQVTSGLNQGIANVLGAPVDVLNLGLRAGASGLKAVTGGNVDIQLPEQAFGGSQTFSDLMAPSIKPPSADPTKQFVRRTVEDVGGAVAPGLGIAAKAAKPLKVIATELGLATGTGAGAAVAEQIDPNNPMLELAGSILGGLSAYGAGKALKKVITPNPISPTRQAAAETLKKEGVELSAGQKTGNEGLRYAESELGGQKMVDLMERQSEQFTSAALLKAGVRSNRATPEVMDSAFKEIGDEFDSVALNSKLPLDRQLGADLRMALDEYEALVGESQRAPILRDFISDLVKATKGSPDLDGKVYQAMRSRLERIARNVSDPQLSDALRSMRAAMDDAVERWLTNNRPDDVGLWQDVRNRYKNLLVVERTMMGGGAQTASGLISPAQLRMAAAQQNGRGYVRGTTDYSDLAHSGVQTMTPLPNSGTAPRMNQRPTLWSTITWPVRKAAGAALSSRPGQAYLGNQVIKKASGDGQRSGFAAFMAALANQQEPPVLNVDIPTGVNLTPFAPR
jgi:hypothetical protein